MGTNFYWLEPAPRCPHCDKEIGEPSEGEHIGKRSAAGLYCYDCGVTLCRGGESHIHYSRNGDWHEACPKCGAQQSAEAAVLKRGPMAVELGFAQPEEARPSGVAGAASFSWAVEPSVVRQRCEAGLDQKLVIDEYGRTLTGAEFLRMLKANCPIEFTKMIGRNF